MVEELLLRIRDLKESEFRLPTEIAAAKHRASDAREALAPLADQVSEAENRVALEVLCEATADTGSTIDGRPRAKPRFGNEAARKAEVQRRLALNHEYERAVAAFRAAQSEMRTADIEVDRLERREKALRAVVDLTVAEVYLLTRGR